MILMNDFKRQAQHWIEEELVAMRRVLESGWYVLGEEVDKFEKEFATASNVSHCVGVANGLDAIEIGLRASGVGQGDEVITTPMTAFATLLAIYRAGATPVLADIDLETGLLDVKSAERCVSKKTKGVLLVHLYGHVAKMDEWVSFCKANKIELFEDCAQSHLAKWSGKTAGNFGSWGAYSFYPTKNLGAIGDAGALVTNDANIAAASQSLRNYGSAERYYHDRLGLNSRLDPLQAALLSVHLKYLEESTQKRREIGARYRNEISNSKIRHLAAPQHQENHCYHLFVVMTDRRAELMQHLKEKDVQSIIHYPVCHQHQKSVPSILQDQKGLARSEKFAKECLSIPCHPWMTEKEVSTVIQALNSF